MTAIASDTRDSAPPQGARSRRGKVVTIVLAVVAVALAVVIGANESTIGYLTPITAVVGIGAMFVLSRLAMDRFEWFIWIVLLTRPLLDLAKPDAGAAREPTSQLATLVGAIVIVGGVIWFAAISRKGDRLPMGVISRSLILLTLTSFISVWMSADRIGSLGQVARTTGAVVVFVCLEQLIRTRKLALQTLVVCGLSAAFPLIIGLVQMPFRDTSNETVASRISSTFLHPNTLGLFLVIFILMLYPLRRHVGKRMRWAFVAAMLAGSVELVFTASRGAWIVLVVGFAVIGLLVKEERKIFWIGPAVLGLTAIAVPSLVVRLADLSTEDTIGGRPGNSATWRIDHYASLLDNSQVSVFGIGPKMSDYLTDGGKPPHNDALRMLIENGVVGLFCYVAFVIGLVLVAMHGLRRLHTGFDRALAVGYMAVVVAFISNSMGSNVITQFVILIYLLGLAAIVQALAQLADPAPPGSLTTSDRADAVPTQNGSSEGSHGNP